MSGSVDRTGRPDAADARRERLAADDRGQTVLDYGIGVGVFLVALVFVLGTVPGMFAPFEAPDETQLADRAATQLGTNSLGDPNEPYVLDRECTFAFFHQLATGDAAPGDCRFDTSATDLRGIFGYGGATELNVTIQTLDGDVADGSYDGTTVTLAAGDPVPPTDVTTARRAVFLDGDTYRLEVHAW